MHFTDGSSTTIRDFHLWGSLVLGQLSSTDGTQTYDLSNVDFTGFDKC
jgi:hypothetical protein